MACTNGDKITNLLTAGPTDRCGIFRQAGQSLRHIEPCCSGPVHDYEGCFQYCDAQTSNSNTFSLCLTMDGVNTTATVVSCGKPEKGKVGNGTASSGAVEVLPGGNGGRIGKLGMVVVVLVLSGMFY